MPPTQVTPEFRSEIRNVVHTDRFDVGGYTSRDGGVEATITTFLKFGDIPVPEVAKIVASVPAPQREKVWRDMVPSMSEGDLLEGVVFGVVPIDVLSVALQMKLPVHVIYENGSKVSVEVLIGALKGVDKKRVMDLIKTLPSAKQKQVWDGYVATLTPEEISAGVKAGEIPAEYDPQKAVDDAKWAKARQDLDVFVQAVVRAVGGQTSVHRAQEERSAGRVTNWVSQYVGNVPYQVAIVFYPMQGQARAWFGPADDLSSHGGVETSPQTLASFVAEGIVKLRASAERKRKRLEKAEALEREQVAQAEALRREQAEKDARTKRDTMLSGVQEALRASPLVESVTQDEDTVRVKGRGVKSPVVVELQDGVFTVDFSRSHATSGVADAVKQVESAIQKALRLRPADLSQFSQFLPHLRR